MTRQQENHIRAKLHIFTTFVLVIACMVMLASCGGGGGGGAAVIDSNGMPVSDTVTRTITSANVVAGETSGQRHVAGEAVVILRGLDDQPAFLAVIGARKWRVVTYSADLQMYTVATDATSEETLLAVVKEIQALPYVAGATPNYVSVGPKAKTADPSWAEDAKSWNMTAINLPAARDALIGPQVGVDVAVIDGRFSDRHEELRFKEIETVVPEPELNPQFVAGVRGSRGSPSNPNHGMHVAGIIAAAENGLGLVGVAARSSVTAFDPYTEEVGASMESILLAMRRAAFNKVVNLSLGNQLCKEGGQCIEASSVFPVGRVETVKVLVAAIDNAISLTNGRALFVQASGNEGESYLGAPQGAVGESKNKIYADHNGIIATALSVQLENTPEIKYADMQARLAANTLVVGAYSMVSGAKKVTAYTMLPSPGASMLAANFIVAPGGSPEQPVYSALLPNFFGTSQYGYLYGTSMAAPHVSGVAALVMQANPGLKATEVREIILTNADEVVGANGLKYRALNAEKAVRAAVERIAKPSASIRVVSPASPKANAAVVFEPVTGASPNGAITSFTWDFGDGGSASNAGGQVQHAYATAGSYVVRLTIMDARGRTNTATQTVAVAALAAESSTMDALKAGLYEASLDGQCYYKVSTGAQVAAGEYRFAQSRWCLNAARTAWTLQSDSGSAALVMLSTGAWSSDAPIVASNVDGSLALKHGADTFQKMMLTSKAVSGFPSGALEFALTLVTTDSWFEVFAGTSSVYQNAASIDALLTRWNVNGGASLQQDGGYAWAFADTLSGSESGLVRYFDASASPRNVIASGTWNRLPLPGGNDGIKLNTPTGLSREDISGDDGSIPFYVRRPSVTGDTGVREGLMHTSGATKAFMQYNRTYFDARLRSSGLPATAN